MLLLTSIQPSKVPGPYGGRTTEFHAPPGIWLHASFDVQWLRGPAWRIQVLNDFIDWAHGHEGVWFVTVNDCLDFMEDPHNLSTVGAFPPFINIPKSPRPLAMASTKYYTNGVVRTASEPPPFRPTKETVFKTWIDIPGGAWNSVVLPPYGPGTFDGWIDVSNNTAQAFQSLEFRFEISGGIVTNFFGHDVRTDGNHYVVSPYGGPGTVLPLNPTEVLRLPFRGGFATNGVPAVASVALQGRSAGTPQTTIEIATTETGQLTVSWNPAAYSYTVESTADLARGTFSPLISVWNQTNLVLPANQPAASLRLKMTTE